WAHTLCERLTGVRLIRSTCTPSSASFIAAANPASPPPTIITRSFAIAVALDSGHVGDLRDSSRVRSGCSAVSVRRLARLPAAQDVGSLLVAPALRFPRPRPALH